MPHPCERRWIQNHLNQVRESNRESLKKWKLNNPERYKAFHNVAVRKWRQQNPEKHKASQNAYRELPIGLFCSQCDSTENLERHHPDYSKPKEVITLCRSCHLKVHGETKK